MSWQIDIYNLEFIDKILKKVLLDKESVFGTGLLTSLFRIGDSGVHGTLPLRAVDERCRDKAVGDRVAGYINERWVYDPDRPQMQVCAYHDAGGGWHLHYQVHPKTVRRK